MQIADMREVEPGTVLAADLAIIGTGPAGLSIAREFLDSRGGGVWQVILLESGGLKEEDEVSARETFESIGAPRIAEPRLVRNRVLGGTSHTWSGRCRSFDRIDYESRPWVPFSGWPVTPDEMLRYERRAAEAMNIGPSACEPELWNRLHGARPDAQMMQDTLQSCFWQYSRDPDRPLEFFRYGPQFLKHRADNIRLFHNATVTQIETDPHGRRLTALEVTSTPGRTVRIVPKIAVLAAGGIENPRLLLASNRVSPNGLGNASGQVGRFLMDHPKTVIGRYPPQAADALRQRLGLFSLKHEGRTHFYTHGVAISPALQRERELLNCAAYLSEHRAPDDPWDALKRLFARHPAPHSARHPARHPASRLKDIKAVALHPGLVADGLYRRLVRGGSLRHKIDGLVVDCLVEQAPDPDSRITLSRQRDEFGVALPRLDWKVSDLERRSVAEMARLFAGEMRRSGLPEPQPPDWLRDNALEAIPFRDAAHPTGTTRMSDDPKTGAVDADCRVHGVEGLFVAGSSVFPTASHANPTLMIAALALRLADTLKSRYLALLGAPHLVGWFDTVAVASLPVL